MQAFVARFIARNTSRDVSSKENIRHLLDVRSCHLISRPMKLRLVRSLEAASSEALMLTLYRCESGLVRGWFVGPVLAEKGVAHVPYEPKSQNLLAALATVRAIEIAETHGLEICVIDPDSLWDEAWGRL